MYNSTYICSINYKSHSLGKSGSVNHSKCCYFRSEKNTHNPSCNFTSFCYSRRHHSCPPNGNQLQKSAKKENSIRSSSSGLLINAYDEITDELKQEIMTDKDSPEGGKYLLILLKWHIQGGDYTLATRSDKTRFRHWIP